MGPARRRLSHDALTMRWVWFGPTPNRSKPDSTSPLAPVPVLGIASGCICLFGGPSQGLIGSSISGVVGVDERLSLLWPTHARPEHLQVEEKLWSESCAREAFHHRRYSACGLLSLKGQLSRRARGRGGLRWARIGLVPDVALSSSSSLERRRDRPLTPQNTPGKGTPGYAHQVLTGSKNPSG